MIHKHPVGAFTLSNSTATKIDREQILAKYWELANLTPEETKGNVTGQLKALDALCKELRLKPIKILNLVRHRKSIGQHGCLHDPIDPRLREW